jgi:four helix bundle suffix protein
MSPGPASRSCWPTTATSSVRANLAEWPADHPHARRLRSLNRIPNATFETFRKGIEHPDPAICANVIIGLIKVTTFLLDRQIAALEQAFLQDGGLRERMSTARRQSRRAPN